MAVGDVQSRVPADGARPELQGDEVALTFMADAGGRLRRLTVAFRVDDRDTTITAVLGDFGTPVTVDVPPKSEIYREPL